MIKEKIFEHNSKILIVDDEITTVAIIKKTLEKYGFNYISSANSGEEAIRIVQTHQPELILMDVNLNGELDGIETSEKIHEIADIPIIFVTACTFDVTIQSAKQIAPYGYLIKPFNNQQIYSAVEMALNRSSLEKRLKESEVRHKQMISNISDVIAILNHEGIIDYVSPNIENCFGWKPEDLIGASSWSIVHPDDLELVQKKFLKLLEMDKSFITVEFRFKCQNGFYKDIELNAVNLTNDNAISGVLINYHDITERKKAEEELRKSREDFREYFEMGPIGMCVTSLEKGWIEVNDKLCDMLGYTKNELYKLTWADLTHPDDLEKDVTYFNEVIEGKRDKYEIDKRFIQKDGSIVHTALSVACRRNQYGLVDYFLAQLLDITERKLIEETQLFLLNTFENNINGGFFTSLASYLVKCLNMDYVCIDKLEEGNLAATTLAIYFDGRFEDNVVYTLKETPCGDVVGKTICCFPQKVRHLFPNDVVLQEMKAESYIGTTLWSSDHKPIGLIAIIGRKPLHNRHLAETIIKLVAIRAASELERMQAEEALRKSEAVKNTMVSNISDVIVIIDKNGINQFNSPNISKLFGWQPEELVGKNTWDNIHPDDLEEGQKFFSKVLSEPIAKGTTELRYKRKDGNYSWIEINVINLLHDKDIQGILGNYKDITERKKVEQELESYRNHLEELVKVRTEELEKANLVLRTIVDKEKELNEMKSRFISTTSHEFRTPLTSVLSSTELLQRYSDKWSGEKKDEHFNRIQKSVAYLTHLLDEILIINKVDSGKQKLNPEKVNLHKFSEECLQDAKLVLKQNQELLFNYKSTIKEFHLDPKLMRFIINNLLSNAIKYSPQGGNIELQISTESKFLIIKVMDEGMGIRQEDLQKIFDSFYRTKNVEGISGTGLGLSIVKRAVELHKGVITVDSEICKGTTFTVKIPVSAAKE